MVFKLTVGTPLKYRITVRPNNDSICINFLAAGLVYQGVGVKQSNSPFSLSFAHSFSLGLGEHLISLSPFFVNEWAHKFSYMPIRTSSLCILLYDTIICDTIQATYKKRRLLCKCFRFFATILTAHTMINYSFVQLSSYDDITLMAGCWLLPTTT